MKTEKGRCPAVRSMFSVLYLTETLHVLSGQRPFMPQVTDEATEAWRGPATCSANHGVRAPVCSAVPPALYVGAASQKS